MSGEAGNPHTGLEIGRTLQLAREKRGLSLQQVEEATKIRTRYLRDLENENFDVLPAVYVLGSLKTYAGHLGLDGMAMTRELKRRQASLQAEQDEAREDPPFRELRGLLASLGRLVGIGEAVEDEAGTMPDSVHSPRLHVSFAVVLVFVLATALVSSLGGEDRSLVSQVREPKISQISSGIALIGNAEDDGRSAEDLVLVNQPEEQPDIPVRDAGNDDKVKAGGSGQEKDAHQTARVTSSSTTSFAGGPTSAPASTPASAVASAPASASANASPASTGSEPAPATTTLAPTRTRPVPAARKEPAAGNVAAAPAAPPARITGSTSLRKTQAGPVDAARFGNGIPNKAKKALDSAW
jgi:transcriptional regulator with XRE-family HTH domain